MRRSNAHKTLSYMRDRWLSERAEASFGADASDYSTIFMPWGPNWNAKKITKMVSALYGSHRCSSRPVVVST